MSTRGRLVAYVPEWLSYQHRTLPCHNLVSTEQRQWLCVERDIQEYYGLIFRSLPEAHIRSLGQVFGGLVGTSIFATFRSSTGVSIGIERDDGMRGERCRGKVGMEAAREMRGQVRVGLQMLRQRW